MASYDKRKLKALVGKIKPKTAAKAFEKEVIPYLVDVWLDEYNNAAKSNDIVETKTSNPNSEAGTQFSYLFDVKYQRLIAAWGVSHGRDGVERDHARMAGHPLTDSGHYHRGHAIPHRLGGPTDINLVPQLGAVNVGAFRRLENLAVKTPGALYFTHWVYDRSDSQRPKGVEQGLLCPGGPVEIETHGN